MPSTFELYILINFVQGQRFRSYASSSADVHSISPVPQENNAGAPAATFRKRTRLSEIKV